MSLIATQGKERAPIMEEGIYAAVCSKIVDLGMQYSPIYNNTYPKVRVFWEIPGQTLEVNGQLVNREISKDFTSSLNEKSKLRQFLQSWRGKVFTPEELQGFDLKKILGAGCQVQVMHKTTEKGDYANVENVIALPKGTPVAKPTTTIYFDMDEPETYAAFNQLPFFVQEKISKAENFLDTGLVMQDQNHAESGGQEYATASAGAPVSTSFSAADFEEISVDEGDVPF